MQGEGLDEKDIATRKIEGFVRLREAVHYSAGSGKFWQIFIRFVRRVRSPLLLHENTPDRPIAARTSA
jgi:hypothetical protein